MHKKKRLFFACFPGSEGKDVIAAYQHHLIFWSHLLRIPRQENWHITLGFLGNVDRAQTEAIACEKLMPSAVIIRRFRPEVYMRKTPTLVLAVESNEGLLENYQQVRSLCRKQHLRLEKRPFRPHITLAYLRQKAEQSQVSAICNFWANDLPSLSCQDRIHKLVLVQSILSPGGARYMTEKTW